MLYNTEFDNYQTNTEDNKNNYSIAIISKYNSKLMGINEAASTHWIVTSSYSSFAIL